MFDVELVAAMSGHVPPARACVDSDDLAFWFACVAIALGARRRRDAERTKRAVYNRAQMGRLLPDVRR